MKSKFLPLLPLLLLPVSAQEAPEGDAVTSDKPVLESVKVTVEQAEPDDESPEFKAKKAEKEELALENALLEEQTKAELAELRLQIEKLKLETEAITARLALDSAKEQQRKVAALAALQEQNERLELEASVAKAKADTVLHTLKLERANEEDALADLDFEMKKIDVEKMRKAYINANPEYLDEPLKNGDTLVISDRRIPLNGPITYYTANYITERLSFFNNLDADKPIFIVIDASPGGSVMAGYRILKAMEGSEAPIHVVVKSHAASMAACITTLAEKSYAFPNAIILHHQLSLTLFMARLNLTEQKEMAEESNEWWIRLATPIAKKMGITLDEFVKQMYENSSSGDWSEFATEAQKLKWVDTIVSDIEETSLLKNPDAQTEEKKSSHGLVESLTSEGKPVMYLPRPNPRDRYFIYNPDSYYSLR